MKHVFYALFPDRETGHEALKDLAEAGVPPESYSVIVHKNPYELEDSENLSMSETDASEELVEGVAMGGLAGSLGVALLAIPLGLVGFGPLAAAIALGGWAGGVYGGLGAFLSALDVPDRTLAGLADRLERGELLMTVETQDSDLEAKIELIFERHGAVAREKHLI